MAACGSDEDAEGGGVGGSAPAVVQWGTRGILGTSSWASHLVAMGQGYFDEIEKRFGTSFEFTDVGSSESLELLDSGAIDVLGLAFPTYAAARLSGFDFVAIVEAYERPNIALVGRPALADRGRDVRSYRDARWGHLAPGSTTEAVARAAATDSGLTWDSLETVAFGQIPTGVASLKADRLDVISVDVGTAGRLLSEDDGYLVYNSNEHLNTIGGGPIVKSDFVEQYPDLVQAIVDAYLKAMADLHAVAEDPDAVLALFPPDYQELLSAGFAEAWELTEPGQRGDGRFEDAQISSSIDFLLDYDLVDADQRERLGGLWKNDFVDASSVTVEEGT